jgi:hypothetical protein
VIGEIHPAAQGIAMGRIRNIQFGQMLAASPIVAPSDYRERPALLVVESIPGLAPSIDEVCGFLGIRSEGVEDTLAIGQALRDLQPIGVIATADEIDCAVYDLMMAVAGFEPDLPVLLVTDNRPSVRGAVNGAQRLWQLGGLIHLARRLDTNDLVEFLFRAARRSGFGRLMPAKGL